MRRRLAAAIAVSVAAASLAVAYRAHADDAAEETEPAALFRAGTDALASDHPTEAIAKLEALGDRGVVDPVASYNRGLAYAARVHAGAEQPGDLGRAAHGFEEARELSRDAALVTDATRALTVVRSEVARRRSRAGDPIELEHGVSLGRSIAKLLPENVWAILAAVFSFAFAVGIVLRARASTPRARVTANTTCGISAGLLLVATLIVASARDARLHLREGVIVAPSARLLNASHVAAAGVAALPEAARVRILDEAADFTHIVVSGVDGFVPAGTVVPLARR